MSKPFTGTPVNAVTAPSKEILAPRRLVSPTVSAVRLKRDSSSNDLKPSETLSHVGSAKILTDEPLQSPAQETVPPVSGFMPDVAEDSKFAEKPKVPDFKIEQTVALIKENPEFRETVPLPPPLEPESIHPVAVSPSQLRRSSPVQTTALPAKMEISSVPSIPLVSSQPDSTVAVSFPLQNAVQPQDTSEVIPVSKSRTAMRPLTFKEMSSDGTISARGTVLVVPQTRPQ
ncbi:MAG: hypothetical protein LBQ54_00145 [Planctomycetaceae bacterium]|nr:hypothetical protein [Planctomycetaceae bacterium]